MRAIACPRATSASAKRWSRGEPLPRVRLSDRQRRRCGRGPEDFILKYNLNGIRLSPAAFRRLRQEISLEPCQLDLPDLWGSETFQLHSGLVPVGNDIFKKILVRSSQIPQIDPQKFSLQHWTERLLRGLLQPRDLRHAGR